MYFSTNIRPASMDALQNETAQKLIFCKVNVKVSKNTDSAFD